MSRKAKQDSAKAERKQPTPAEVVGFLMELIRAKFYRGEVDGKKFQQDRQLLLSMVVLWPAKWLNKKGVTLPVDRYRAIVEKVIMDAAAFGTNKIKYRPAYLGRVIQSHFAVHGDEYYAEGKSIVSLGERALVAALATGQAIPQAAPDPLKKMVETEEIVSAGLSKKKAAAKAPLKEQLSLF